MKNTKENKGTYRYERFPRALEANYFKLDERTASNLVEQTAILASHIKYYNKQNKVEGNWEEFFEPIYDYVHKEVKMDYIVDCEKNAKMPPHLAMFFAFVSVFNIAQEELNRISKRHLDYYYTDILKFDRKKEIPDQVHLFLEINKKASKAFVPKGTLFDAGNNSNGEKRLYASDFDLVVNKSQIMQVKTLTLREREEKCIEWEVQEDVLNQAPEIAGEIGFAISSPLFYLFDGKREITFHFAKDADVDFLSKNIKVEYSTLDGWKKVSEVSWESQKGIFTIFKTLPSVVRYNEEVHRMKIGAKDPVLRFLVQEKNLVVDSKDIEDEKKFSFYPSMITKIEVKVEGSRDLSLYNDYGKLNGEMPFMPFGPNPIPNTSRFLIGNNKIFNSFLKAFTLSVKWMGLPENWEDYHESYNKNLKGLDPQKIGADMLGEFSFLKEGIWKNSYSRTKENQRDVIFHYPFEVKKDSESSSVLSSSSELDSLREEHTELSNHAQFGFIQFVSSVDYGHNIYTSLLSRAMAENINLSKGEEKEKHIVPEHPYTPEIHSLSIDYNLEFSTVNQIVGNKTNHKTEEEKWKEACLVNQFFSIHPFKNIEFKNEFTNTFSTSELLNPFSLFRISSNQTYYYFAFNGLNEAGEINAYFEIENTSLYTEGDEFRWRYFANNRWILCEANMLVRDTTKNFDRSGIISFVIPDSMLLNGEDTIWLSLWIIKKEVHSTPPKVLNVRTNCVTATFMTDSKDWSHLKSGLSAGSIQKFVERPSNIKSVEQPYPSFGGKTSEDDIEFYTRVSERLRHKNRASTAWDYEHLTLEAFPQVSFALCLPYTKKKGKKAIEYAPGCVLMLITPDTSILSQENILKPFVPIQTIREICDFLKSVSSPHVEIGVSNFVYKEVTVTCEVQLKRGYSDNSFYRDKINSALKDFIAPWIKGEEEIYKRGLTYKSRNVSDVYFFLESLEYVDFVISAKISLDNQEYTIAQGTIPKEQYEIFTSVENHNITIKNNG